jgi:hypothetical protein
MGISVCSQSTKGEQAMQRMTLDSPDQIIDELMYRSYSHNRRLVPETPPERYKIIFGEAVERMEQRFQMEVRS